MIITRYIELVNFLRKTLTIPRARIRHSFPSSKRFSKSLQLSSKCATYVQETYFYFLKKEKKKATITFQRRKLSKRETALNFFLFHSSSRSTGDEKKNEHDDANFLNRHVTTVRSTKIIIKVYTSRMKVWRNRTVVKVKLVR